MAGTLYVVATPLGNLGDLSPRAADTLKRVSAVAAEDTRHSKPLLNHAGSHAELVSFHSHSSERALARILRILEEGRDVALITDAGTPANQTQSGYRIAIATTQHAYTMRKPKPAPGSAVSSAGGFRKKWPMG